MPDETNPNLNSSSNNQPFKNPADDQETVSFAVMPHDAGEAPNGDQVKMSDINAASEHPIGGGIWHSKSTYIAIGVLVVAALGAMAYFLLWQTDSKSPSENSQQNASRLPRVFLQQYFSVDVCQNESTCGEKADPDNDGLDNYSEFIEQTEPMKADSDEDGLADGDEVKIYLTDPVNKYTDSRPVAEQNGYTDGSQIRNEYDPITPGLKMTDVRKQQIQVAIAEHGLHEPTKTTLTAAAAPQAKTVTVFITNGKFSPETVSINVNDSVVWLNKDATTRQIMSDVHPAHLSLPDLASGTLATNQTFSFKFTTAGSFTYHDETNLTSKGKIEVK
jgi:plastocyanin